MQGMRSWDGLPSGQLAATGTNSDAFLARGVVDFRAAASHLHGLPYGRNSSRGDFRLVLEEGRGTCSTKHALLAALAREQQFAVDLMVGVYDMSEANTPGVGSVLELYGLTSLPEAHCYLLHAGDRIDITRSGVTPQAQIARFHEEWKIDREQIGDHKQELHRSFIAGWLAEDAGRAARLGGLVGTWRIREECILALQQAG